jgi:hypothetical protein
MYKKPKNFERSIGIFKDFVGGLLTIADIGRKRELSSASVASTLNFMQLELRDFIEHNKLPQPKSWAREEFSQEKEYWVDIVTKYVAWVESQPIVSMDESPLVLGFTSAMCGKFSTVGITTIGELLDKLKHDKRAVTRLLGTNVTAVDALENKFIKAGLNPYGGRAQSTSPTAE